MGYSISVRASSLGLLRNMIASKSPKEKHYSQILKAFYNTTSTSVGFLITLNSFLFISFMQIKCCLWLLCILLEGKVVEVHNKIRTSCLQAAFLKQAWSRDS